MIDAIASGGFAARKTNYREGINQRFDVQVLKRFLYKLNHVTYEVPFVQKLIIVVMAHIMLILHKFWGDSRYCRHSEKPSSKVTPNVRHSPPKCHTYGEHLTVARTRNIPSMIVTDIRHSDVNLQYSTVNPRSLTTNVRHSTIVNLQPSNYFRRPRDSVYCATSACRNWSTTRDAHHKGNGYIFRELRYIDRTVNYE